MLNRSLETHPGFVLIGFVCVDMGSALCCCSSSRK